jgi:hypothetical protein
MRYRRILGFLAVATAIALALVGGGLYYMTAMPGRSYQGSLPPLTEQERQLGARLKTHVTAIASAEHNVAHYQKLEQAANYIETTLQGSGCLVRRQEFESTAGSVRNLEITVPCSAPTTPRRRLVVVGAHYDSARGAPGADDNASGVAALIELAGLLGNLVTASDRDVRLVFFVNEEIPYFKTKQMGSWVHASELSAQGRDVVAMVSLETIGYYSDAIGSQHYPFPFALIYPNEGNFVGFVGTLGSRTLVRRAIASFRQHPSFPSEGVASPGFIPGVDWSDHWSYGEHGYPGVMITDTALYRYPYYHTAADTPDKVDYERLTRVVKGIESVIRELAAHS